MQNTFTKTVKIMYIWQFFAVLRSTSKILHRLMKMCFPASLLLETLQQAIWEPARIDTASHHDIHPFRQDMFVHPSHSDHPPLVLKRFGLVISCKMKNKRRAFLSLFIDKITTKHKKKSLKVLQMYFSSSFEGQQKASAGRPKPSEGARRRPL